MNKTIYEKPYPVIVAGKFVQETFFKNNPQLDQKKVLDNVRARVDELWSADAPTRMQATWKIRPGYREGVYLVELRDVEGFKLRVRKLEEGDHLFGRYHGRVKGEKPRKKMSVLDNFGAPNAKYVDAVLYARHVIEESRDIIHEGADFEVITFLAKETECDEPMETETLLHNFFLSDGGTNPKMTNDEFVEALRKSHNYWKDRAYIYSE